MIGSNRRTDHALVDRSGEQSYRAIDIGPHASQGVTACQYSPASKAAVFKAALPSNVRHAPARPFAGCWSATLNANLADIAEDDTNSRIATR
jgi:hypothetical protein